MLLLDTLILSPGAYTFRVTLLKEPGPRRAATSVKIWIAPNVSPRVAIEPLKVRKVNPGERILLQGQIEAPALALTEEELSSETTFASPTVQMQWVQEDGENIMEYPRYISIRPHSSSLAVREGVLQAGQDYRFRFTVRDTRYPGVEGFAQIAFRVNTPPSSGQCSVSPKIGHGDTNFEMLCKNWVDEADDLPFNFEYRYTLPASSTPLDEIPLGTLDKNVFVTGLPAPPDVEARHDVGIVIYVIDQSGGKARAESSVEVRLCVLLGLWCL